MLTVLEFLERDGASPFGKWFAALDAIAAAKITTAVRRLELGNFSNVKGVGAGVFEYRIDFGPGYRVYFGKDGDALVILLGGGPKSARIETSQRRKCGGRTTRSASRRRRDDASHARVQGNGAGPH
jgi:putative addiction module killer protein